MKDQETSLVKEIIVNSVPMPKLEAPVSGLSAETEAEMEHLCDCLDALDAANHWASN